MFEKMTDDQLIEQNVAFKQEERLIKAKRTAIADELRKRDLQRRLDRMSDTEKASLKKLFGGNIVVTPEPTQITTERE